MTEQRARYDAGFYEEVAGYARSSARVVVPLVLDLLHPSSVVDVGCGLGSWAATFGEAGCDVWGIDGAEVDRSRLEIAPDRFVVADLTEPLRLDRRFDLAVSLEVAEHLPPEVSGAFVTSLTSLAPTVLFSAAIPHQGGTHHVNEQWPDYWARRFEDRGFVAIDFLRRRVWDDSRVAWWYAQNMVLYLDRALADRLPGLASFRARPEQLPIVHPAHYEAVQGVSKVAREIAELVAPDEAFVFVGSECYPPEAAVGRPAIPFLERDGAFWGPPPDDETAVRELERARQEGATVVVFAELAWWWFDVYPGFIAHLRRTYREVPRQDGARTVAFDLRAG